MRSCEGRLSQEDRRRLGRRRRRDRPCRGDKRGTARASVCHTGATSFVSTSLALRCDVPGVALGCGPWPLAVARDSQGRGTEGFQMEYLARAFLWHNSNYEMGARARTRAETVMGDDDADDEDGDQDEMMVRT